MTDRGGESGYDGGKQVKGRKRHILVDPLGLSIAVLVTGAHEQDRDGGQVVIGISESSIDPPGLYLGRWRLDGATRRLGGAASTLSQDSSRDCQALRRHERVGGFAQKVERGANIQLVVQIQAIEQGL